MTENINSTESNHVTISNVDALPESTREELRRVIELIESSVSEVEVSECCVEEVDWDVLEEPCPFCGGTEIGVLRPREEMYSVIDVEESSEKSFSGITHGTTVKDGGEYDCEYNGIATGAVIVQGDIMGAFCYECDTTLYSCLRDELTRYESL